MIYGPLMQGPWCTKCEQFDLKKKNQLIQIIANHTTTGTKHPWKNLKETYQIKN